VTVWVCGRCGNEYPDTVHPPAGACAICADEREALPPDGQRWTSHEEIAAETRVVVEFLEPDLYAVTTVHEVGIGQRGLLVRTPEGNLLWEPPGHLDQHSIDTIAGLGGVAVISASHPHLVGAAVSWSHALGHPPVLRAAADRDWVLRPDPVVRLWSDTVQVLPGLTLVPCGGHFAGSGVCHWSAGADGRGVLLTGDTVAVGGDRRSVSAMRSYVNDIPLPGRAIHAITAALAPYRYDRIYGGFDHIDTDARRIVADSFSRYLSWLNGDPLEQATDSPYRP